jgi:hypothetical protein
VVPADLRAAQAAAVDAGIGDDLVADQGLAALRRKPFGRIDLDLALARRDIGR